MTTIVTAAFKTSAKLPGALPVTVHRGLSQFSRRFRHHIAKPPYRRENGTVPLAPRKGTGPFFDRRFSRKTRFAAEKWTSPQLARRGRCRRGLAPLELVIALPVLLCLMALMINIGSVTSWKLRALGVARNSLWANRSPRPTADFGPATDFRSTAGFPPPASWLGDAPTFTDLPAPKVDGPRATSLGPSGNVIVNSNDPATDIMNPILGLVQGSATLTRPYPYSVLKEPTYSLNAHTELLNNTWAFSWMGIGGNLDFRIPVIYYLLPGVNQEVWANAYGAARQVIINMLTGSKALWPLDRDEDIAYYGQLIKSVDFHWSIINNFHPAVYMPWTLSKEAADVAVYGRDSQPGVIDHIQGNQDRHVDSLARTMTEPRYPPGSPADNAPHGFLDLYEKAVQVDPSLEPVLRPYINELTQFLATLP
jgi:hypothetical protein